MSDFVVRSRAINISYAIFSASVLPFAIWCTNKHMEYYSKQIDSKLVHRLSMAVYICTIIVSIFLTIQSIAACFVDSSSPAGYLFLVSWFIQNTTRLAQWLTFAMLLFSRYIYILMLREKHIHHN